MNERAASAAECARATGRKEGRKDEVKHNKTRDETQKIDVGLGGEKSRGRRREGGREESDDELAEDEESRLSMFPVEGAWVGG